MEKRKKVCPNCGYILPNERLTTYGTTAVILLILALYTTFFLPDDPAVKGFDLGFGLSFLVFAILSTKEMARNRGRNYIGWTWFAILTSPILTIFCLWIAGDTDERHRQKIWHQQRERELENEKPVKPIVSYKAVSQQSSRISIRCPRCNTPISPEDAVCRSCNYTLPTAKQYTRNVQSEIARIPGRSRYVGPIVFLGILILLAVTNPDLNHHQEEVKTLLTTGRGNYYLKELLQKMGVKSASEWEYLFMPKEFKNKVTKTEFEHSITETLSAWIAEEASKLWISRKNYVLFSVTVLTVDGESRDIGIGILGNVFLFSAK